jgi:adenylate cyclase
MKKILIILLTFNCLLLTIHCSARLQGQARIDSLLNELPQQKQDTNKVKVLNDLSFEFRSVSPDEGLKYGTLGLALATKLDWKAGIAYANNCMGINHKNKDDYPMAMACYQAALKIYEQVNDKTSVAMVTGNIANIYFNESKYELALEYMFKVLKIREETGDRKALTNSYSSIAGVYQVQCDYNKALEYYDKCLNIAIETDNKKAMMLVACNVGLLYRDQGDIAKALQSFFKALKLADADGNLLDAATVNGNIGNIYKTLDENEKALNYYNRALDQFEKAGNKSGIARIKNSMGQLYKNQKDFTRALECYFASIKIDESINNRVGVAIALGDVGNVYKFQHNYTMAIDYLQRSLAANKEIGRKRGVANSLIEIGDCFIAIVTDTFRNKTNTSAPAEVFIDNRKPISVIPRGRTAILNSAIDYLSRGLNLSIELNIPDELMEAYGSISRAYKLNGDYEKALNASQHYYEIKDSLYSKENNEKILKIGMKNEYDRQRLSDSLKVAEKEKIASLNLQKQKSYTYMGVAGILLLAGFSFFIVKERGKSENARKQSENLLLNILPEEVATELKTTGTTTAKHFDNVTVIFTDFVNFTQASESMDPQNLIDELHACFKKFDEISEKYNIEKIKTIGDAYLAVAGLPSPYPNHAENIVKAAQEITAFMEDRLGKMGTERTFQVRVGIHSGSVVAGIVGVKKFAYDIWGDTVNTAARMEQNSEAGKINISQTTYELVKDKFSCEYRGEVAAKGKGVMRMYFVG